MREGGKLRPATWAEAFDAVAAKMKATAPDRIGVIAGDLQDAESMKAALDLFGGLGVTSLDCRQDGAELGAGPRESWLFNSTIAGHRARRRGAADRDQPAARGAGAERPHPQDLAGRQDLRSA